MDDLLLALAPGVWNMEIWYALPAVIAISLVYSATRHEAICPILAHASRVAAWIVGAMFLVFVALEIVGKFT